MSLSKLCEIIDSNNYSEFIKFFNEIDFVSTDCITSCADFIFNPFKEEYFKVLCNQVFDKTPKHMLYILNYCVRFNNLKAIKLIMEYKFDTNTKNFDYPFYITDPILCISQYCIHSKCDNVCEYEDVINFFLDSDSDLHAEKAFIYAVENKNYCVCRALLKYGYIIDYSSENIHYLVYCNINSEDNLRFLLNECDLQINFSNPEIIKAILSVIKNKNYKVLLLLIGQGLDLHNLAHKINDKKYDEYFINTLNILKGQDLDTETICKLMYG
ncbi:ankyrin repeat protein [Saudi moumouvirus]|nr:ankyrin repeat protein [Saudi moumouvirus]